MILEERRISSVSIKGLEPRTVLNKIHMPDWIGVIRRRC
jgi:hypothetical protein